jgi:L-lactate dehydrogenase complex protein LldG
MSAPNRLEERFERHDVGVEVVPATESTSAIADALRPPALGVPLALKGVTLPDAVTTDLTTAAIEAAATGVTRATGAVEEYGSLTIESRGEGTELVSLFVERHVAVIRASDVDTSMADCVDRLAERAADGASAILATGPSATADMGALVHGAHGPREVHVVLLEDR